MLNKYQRTISRTSENRNINIRRQGTPLLVLSDRLQKLHNFTTSRFLINHLVAVSILVLSSFTLSQRQWAGDQIFFLGEIRGVAQKPKDAVVHAVFARTETITNSNVFTLTTAILEFLAQLKRVGAEWARGRTLIVLRARHVALGIDRRARRVCCGLWSRPGSGHAGRSRGGSQGGTRRWLGCRRRWSWRTFSTNASRTSSISSAPNISLTSHVATALALIHSRVAH